MSVPVPRGTPRVVVVLGTRPEAIKLVPVVRALRASELFSPVVVTTGQHHAVVDDVLSLAGVHADAAIDVLHEGASLAQLTAHLLAELDPVLARLASGKDVHVMVQGDTTTALAAALASFYRHLPVVHVEAGLRTETVWKPFPEELNRRLVTRITALHLAATPRARDNLLAEGVARDDVVVTGNTVIDALEWAAGLDAGWTDPALAALDAHDGPVLVVTAHRRESWGEGMAAIVDAVARLTRSHPHLLVVWSLHPNPAVRAEVRSHLDGLTSVVLTDPLGYVEFAHLLRRATVVLTDSGGIQEEAPALGVPVLVARDTTERPEAIEFGVARLVGTDAARIVAAASELLADPAAHAAMARVANPFGDGHAAARIVAALGHRVHGTPAPQEFQPAPTPGR